jgi:hypothetical protein
MDGRERERVPDTDGCRHRHGNSGKTLADILAVI